MKTQGVQGAQRSLPVAHQPRTETVAKSLAEML